MANTRVWIAAFLVALGVPVIGGLWSLSRGIGLDLVQPVVTVIQIVAVSALIIALLLRAASIICFLRSKRRDRRVP
jgi:hypothetical protein